MPFPADIANSYRLQGMPETDIPDAVRREMEMKMDPLRTGKCSCPMWMDGLPAGRCDEPAFGVYIDGPRFRDAWIGEVRHIDGGYSGFVPDLACPKHGGPQETGPRVFQDGFSDSGHRMWCAVYEDFTNLQESPAEFDTRPWVAIERLQKNHPRAALSRTEGGERE